MIGIIKLQRTPLTLTLFPTLSFCFTGILISTGNLTFSFTLPVSPTLPVTLIFTFSLPVVRHSSRHSSLHSSLSSNVSFHFFVALPSCSVFSHSSLAVPSALPAALFLRSTFSAALAAALVLGFCFTHTSRFVCRFSPVHNFCIVGCFCFHFSFAIVHVVANIFQSDFQTCSQSQTHFVLWLPTYF